MKKKLLIISLVLSLSLISALSFAYRGMGPRGSRKGHGFRKPMMMRGGGPRMHFMHFMLLKKAGVSDSKIKKMRNIMFDCKEKNAPLFVKEERLKMNLFDEFRKLDYSESKIRSLSSQLGEIRQTIEKNRLNAMLKGMSLLTKSERKKIMELRKEFFKKRHFRRGPHHRGRRGEFQRKGREMPAPR